MTSRYKILIGFLMWSIELGRMDILSEVSCLFQHLCPQIEGHLDYIYSIFSYLYKELGKNSGMMIYDPMYETAYENLFEVFGRYLYQWKDLYYDAQEITPRHMPEAIGNYIVTKAYVDDNHEGNM